MILAPPRKHVTEFELQSLSLLLNNVLVSSLLLADGLVTHGCRRRVQYPFLRRIVGRSECALDVLVEHYLAKVAPAGRTCWVSSGCAAASICCSRYNSYLAWECQIEQIPNRSRWSVAIGNHQYSKRRRLLESPYVVLVLVWRIRRRRCLADLRLLSSALHPLYLTNKHVVVSTTWHGV